MKVCTCTCVSSASAALLFLGLEFFEGNSLFQERKRSQSGVRSREEELSFSTPCASGPCFKICDLCATWGVNTQQHTAFSPSLS